MKRFKVRQTYLLLIFILSVFSITGCGGGDAETGHWLPSQMVSIAVTPATASIPMGAPRQFMATATYTDGTSRDVTASSNWTSGTTGVATVNSTSGLATGVAIGTSVITANFDGKSGSATLTVTAATLSFSIAVTPLTASVPSGLTQRFVAMGAYSDGTSLDISNTVTGFGRHRGCDSYVARRRHWPVSRYSNDHGNIRRQVRLSNLDRDRRNIELIAVTPAAAWVSIWRHTSFCCKRQLL